jgi:plasmid segregation protein ParM
VQDVHVLPQPLGTVLAHILDEQGSLRDHAAAEARVGVLDVGFRTTDYFTLEGLELVTAECLTRNTGMVDVLLELSRVVYRRWGVEVDPHALDAALLRGTLPVGGHRVPLAPALAPLLDRHAEALLAHARMLWGDQARTLERLWLTGGGAQWLGARLLALAPHATLVDDARVQNARGYYRYGCRLRTLA